MFELVGGSLGVMPDPNDNSDSHVVPHHDADARISCEVLSVGDAGGNAKVGVEIDDVHFTEWQSQFLDPGDREVGFVSLGRLTQGQHSVLVFVNPGSGRSDHESNIFDVA